MFPDPHFKKKHHKRKAINQDLVHIIRQYAYTAAGATTTSSDGGATTTSSDGAAAATPTRVYLQSDLLHITEEMMSEFLNCSDSGFQPCVGYSTNSSELCRNPAAVSVKTEREIATESKGLPVYRVLLERI